MRSLRKKLPLLISSLTLVACSTSHEFRVAAVGDTEAGEASGFAPNPGALPGSPGAFIPPGSPGVGNPTGTPPSAPPLIVASGNVLLGPAGQLATGGALNGAAGVVNGTVSAVLLTTTQTVIQLADGASLLVDGVGAALGDAVSIDLAQGQVVGGAQSLVGTSVPGLSSTAGKTLGGTTLASGSSGSSGRITAGGSSTLPPNAGKVLTPPVGVTAVVQPVVSPPPSRPVGL